MQKIYPREKRRREMIIFCYRRAVVRIVKLYGNE